MSHLPTPCVHAVALAAAGASKVFLVQCSGARSGIPEGSSVSLATRLDFPAVSAVDRLSADYDADHPRRTRCVLLISLAPRLHHQPSSGR